MEEYDDLRLMRVVVEGDPVPADIDAYGYLQGVYQGRWPYEPHRVRAARECLPFERPKLAVTAIINEPEDFAARLERAIERSRQSRAIPEVIEPEPEVIEPPTSDLTLRPSVPDRRFRR